MSRTRTVLPPPRVVVAPPGDLNAYTVYEYELDQLGEGSPATLMLNFALFFLGAAVSGYSTLLSVPPDNDRAYFTFLIISAVASAAGVVLAALWWSVYRSSAALVAKIKSRMPPPVVQPAAGTPAGHPVNPP